MLFVAEEPLTSSPPNRDLTMFEVDRVEGSEALVTASDPHLDFWVGVAVDTVDNRLVATTVVKLHGWRGRLYWIPPGSSTHGLQGHAEERRR